MLPFVVISLIQCITRSTHNFAQRNSTQKIDRDKGLYTYLGIYSVLIIPLTLIYLLIYYVLLIIIFTRLKRQVFKS